MMAQWLRVLAVHPHNMGSIMPVMWRQENHWGLLVSSLVKKKGIPALKGRLAKKNRQSVEEDIGHPLLTSSHARRPLHCRHIEDSYRVPSYLASPLSHLWLLTNIGTFYYEVHTLFRSFLLLLNAILFVCLGIYYKSPSSLFSMNTSDSNPVTGLR